MTCLFANLLVAAIVSLLRDGSTKELRALAEGFPERVQLGELWPLVGGVLAVLRDDSDRPLRILAGRANDASPSVRRFAQAARYLLRWRGTLQALSREIAPIRGDGALPLDLDLVVREPWTQLAQVSPEAAELLLARWPVDGARRAAARSRRANPSASRAARL